MIECMVCDVFFFLPTASICDVLKMSCHFGKKKKRNILRIGIVVVVPWMFNSLLTSQILLQCCKTRMTDVVTVNFSTGICIYERRTTSTPHRPPPPTAGSLFVYHGVLCRQQSEQLGLVDNEQEHDKQTDANLQWHATIPHMKFEENQ